MRFPEVTLRLPEWVEDLLVDLDQIYASVEERMRLVIELSRSNIRHETGDRSELRFLIGRSTSCSLLALTSCCFGLLRCSRRDGGDHGCLAARRGLRPGR